MNIPKQRLILEVAYDLISKVHSNMCTSELKRIRHSDLPEMSMEILRQILVLDKKLLEKQGSDNNAE